MDYSFKLSIRNVFEKIYGKTDTITFCPKL